MEPIKKHSGLAVPIPIKDIDTDMLIPAQYLTSTSKDGYGENLFKRLREADSEFPLNLDKYSEASVLIGDENFGCGSSREHAVWALLGWGIRVVVAKSFADIFYSNSSKNGLLLVSLEDKVVEGLQKSATSGELRVDVNLEEKSLNFEGNTYSFEYDSFRQFCLLNGMDDIEYILGRSDKIESFRKEQSGHRYYQSTKPNR